jgi:tetratricopeptide (TPR) repeat protein
VLKLPAIISYLVVTCALSACSLFSNSSSIDHAEALAADGRYEEAIQIYSEHMQERLAVSDRPAWENPYFYMLSIGDLQLRMGQPEQALTSFTTAEEHHVDASLISDRYRSVAIWYEEHGQLEKALAILTKYRDRDSLLFDAMLDRIARAMTAQEAAQTGR